MCNHVLSEGWKIHHLYQPGPVPGLAGKFINHTDRSVLMEWLGYSSEGWYYGGTGKAQWRLLLYLLYHWIVRPTCNVRKVTSPPVAFPFHGLETGAQRNCWILLKLLLSWEGAEVWIQLFWLSFQVSRGVSLHLHECCVNCPSFSSMGRMPWPPEHTPCSSDWTGSLPFLLIISLSSSVADRLVCQEDKCSLRSSERDASSWEKSLQYPSWIQPDRRMQKLHPCPFLAFRDEVTKGRASSGWGKRSQGQGSHFLGHLQLESGKWGQGEGVITEATFLTSALKLTLQVGQKSVPGREDSYGFSVVCKVSQPLQCL